MTVEERLKAVRHTLDLSQKVFAKGIFISTSHLACLETGRRRIKDTILDSISKAYNVNREWLKSGKGEMFDAEPPDSKLEELIDIYKRLNGYFQAYILDHIKRLEALQKREISEN
jgi:transcriptional regulator with XRE-family HTH domain